MSKEVFFEKIRAKSNREHLKNDPYSNVWRKTDGAVLLCDRIKEYCEDQNIKLVVPFEEEYFEPASYQLRLGDLYRIEGVDKHLTDDNSNINYRTAWNCHCTDVRMDLICPDF